MFFLKLFYWIILIATWIAILKYRKTVYDWTGKIWWAEKYLGSGWSIFVIILVWLLLIFLWVWYPFWIYDNYMKWPGNIENTNTEQ